jgi:hypothetical protein
MGRDETASLEMVRIWKSQDIFPLHVQFCSMKCLQWKHKKRDLFVRTFAYLRKYWVNIEREIVFRVCTQTHNTYSSMVRDGSR